MESSHDRPEAKASDKPKTKAKGNAVAIKAIAKARKPAVVRERQPDEPSDREKVWSIIKARGPSKASDVMAPSVALGVLAASVYAVCKQLRDVGKLKATMLDEGRRRVALYEAVGDSWETAGKESAAPAPMQEPPRPVLTPASPEFRETLPESLQAALVAPPGPPPELPAPTDVETRKRHRVFWHQDEIEACIAAWARDHIEAARSLSDKGLRQVALLDGRGYRVKQFQPEAARKFVEKHRALLMAEIDRLRALPPISPHEVATPAAAAPQPQPQPQPEPPPPPSLGALLEQAFTEAVGRAVTLALAATEARLSAAISDALARVPGARPPMPRHDPTPPAAQASGERAPQVIVVNALPEQFNSVKRAFPDLDLRHAQNRCPSEDDPDLVVGLVKFMGHPLDGALRRKYRDKYVRVNGAADSVKLMIQSKLNVAPVVALH